MKIKTIVKIFIVTILIGVSLTGVGYAINESFYTNNLDSKVVFKNERLEKFNSIDIDIDINDVRIIPSDNYEIELSYKENEGNIQYRVDNNTLIIKEKNIKNKNTNNNVNHENYINIYIPKNINLDNIKIVSDVANLSFNKVSSKQLDITCDVGNIKSSDCNIESLKIETDTGNIKINNLKSRVVETSSNLGNIVIKDSTIKERFEANNELGNIMVNGKLYGKSTITTELGNIEVSISENDDLYNCNIKNELGVFILDGQKHNKYLNINNNCKNDINIECGTGKIELNFK